MDAIIHLAAIVGAPACKKDPELAEAVNHHATLKILKYRSTNSIFLNASTGSIYGKIIDLCHEDIEPNPLSVYGITKMEAEKAAMESGNSVSLRFATAFGLAPRLRLDLLPNDFVLNAIKNRYLVIYDKDFRRTFVHIDDIVDSYIFV